MNPVYIPARLSYRAVIMINKKRYLLGYFRKKEDAINAYLNAKQNKHDLERKILRGA
jgi:hypothetical protein